MRHWSPSSRSVESVEICAVRFETIITCIAQALRSKPHDPDKPITDEEFAEEERRVFCEMQLNMGANERWRCQ